MNQYHSGEGRNLISRLARLLKHKIPAYAGMTKEKMVGAV